MAYEHTYLEPKKKKKFNWNTLKIIFMVIAVMGLVSNSYDGSLESRFALGVVAFCGFGALIIEIYNEKKS